MSRRRGHELPRVRARGSAQRPPSATAKDQRCGSASPQAGSPCYHPPSVSDPPFRPRLRTARRRGDAVRGDHGRPRCRAGDQRQPARLDRQLPAGSRIVRRHRRRLGARRRSETTTVSRSQNRTAAKAEAAARTKIAAAREDRSVNRKARQLAEKVDDAWTTDDLNLWSAPPRPPAKLGVIGARQAVSVTGRERRPHRGRHRRPVALGHRRLPRAPRSPTPRPEEPAPARACRWRPAPTARSSTA